MTSVLVLSHARVLSPEGARDRDIPIDPTESQPCDLSAALAREWPTDAHVTQYAPVALTTTDGEIVHPRLTRGAVGDPAVGAISMVALLGDVDPPGHVWTAEWWAETEPRLQTAGHCYYRTRNGARIVATLDEPITIANKADEAHWTATVDAWRAQLAADHGIEIDDRCKDWTRIFRLPNVRRGGRDERSQISCEPRAISAPAPVAAPSPAAQQRALSANDPAAAAVARALVVAETLPASIEGHGGDLALYRAAREIASQLGPDADAIEAVLGVFSARCLPPWPPSKLRYEARRAAEAQAAPEAQYARRLREQYEQPAQAPESADPHDPWHAGWDWAAPIPPIPYLCEGLRLAPSKGKITLIAGAPGAGKGPLADYLAVCFALGLPVLGDLPVERSRVIFVDCEGWALSARRIARMAQALGHAPADLQDWLVPVDASTLGDLSALPNLIALEERVRAIGAGVVILDSYTTATLASGVDANSPQFAQLAQLLGRLGVLVVAVAHARKIDGSDEPQLVDVAYSGAVAALAQTAIVTSRPDASDETRIRIACARAPEARFAPFEIRFSDEISGGLSVERITRENTAPAAHSRATIEAGRVGTYADEIERVLREVDEHGVGMTALKIRRHLAIPQRDWSAALIELRRRGTISEGSSPASPGVVLRWIGGT